MPKQAAHQRGNRQAMRWVLGISILLSVVKFTAWSLTGSDAILSDALESLINVAAGSFALYSMIYAHKPQDEDHPYGHGKIEFFAVGFEGGLILVGGFGIMINALYALWHPQPLERLSLGVYLIAGAGLVNALVGSWMIRRGKRHQSRVLLADGRHLLTDTWTSIGLVVGLIAIQLTGAPWLDPAIALVMAGFILYTGYRLLRQSVHGLMDEADPKLIAEVVALLERVRKPEWISIYNLRIKKMGSFTHLDCCVAVPYYLTVVEAHAIQDRLEASFAEIWGTQYETFTHSEPCFQQLCAYCQVVACPGRRAAFQQARPCSVENVGQPAPLGIAEPAGG
ncbi:MAG: cation diffusion facilitator family transporter [Sphingobacteriia bacterium]